MKKFLVLLYIFHREPEFTFIEAESVDSEKFKAELYRSICNYHDGAGGDWLGNLSDSDWKSLRGSKTILIYEVGEEIICPQFIVNDIHSRSAADDEASEEYKRKQQEEQELRELERLQQKYKK